MAFTLEDGTGVTGANAYVDAAFVTSYLTDRGRETENSWDTAGAPAQQAAIIKATDYMEKRWGKRYKGTKANETQGLGWPRSGAIINGFEFASTDLPDELEEACAEYAVRALAAELFIDPSVSGGSQSIASGPVSRLKEKVGELETDVEYQNGFSRRSGVPTLVSGNAVLEYPAADLLMAELITGGSGVFGRYARA